MKINNIRVNNIKVNFLRLLVVIIFLAPTTVFAQRFRVKVIHIADGDTFTALNRDDLKLRFRLYGIDAPEKRQAFSTVSKNALSKMILGKTVIVDVKSTDGWGRHIVIVSTQTVKDVGARMIEQGMAWHFKRYDSSAHYNTLEKKAQEKKRGLWRDPNPIAPWDYRVKK